MTKIVILKNETPGDHQGWIDACEKRREKLQYRVIDLTRSDWLDRLTTGEDDLFLIRPPGAVGYYKQLYDERLYVISQILGKPIYPSFEESVIYENKRMLAYWLQANRVPHPRTHIFYNKQEAMTFARNCDLPQVAKTAIGAGGSGVKILRDASALEKYISEAFSGKGITRKGGPNFRKGGWISRLIKRLTDIPGSLRYFKNKMAQAKSNPQKGFIILQEYIEVEFEWRAVRIGDSYFAHKKLKSRGELFSGTSEAGWEPPPHALLGFVKEVTSKRNFFSQAVDIFEPEPGHYLVNEMQAFWGSKNPHQMIIEGEPGRYIEKKGNWIFEKGAFNSNNSYDLRLTHALELLERKEI